MTPSIFINLCYSLSYFPVAFTSLIIITLKALTNLFALWKTGCQSRSFVFILFSLLLCIGYSHTYWRVFQEKCIMYCFWVFFFSFVSVPAEKILSTVISSLYEYVLLLKFVLKLWVKKGLSFYVLWKCHRCLQGYIFTCTENKLETPFHITANAYHS